MLSVYRQAAAASECMITYTRHAVWYRDTGQTAAIPERINPDTRHTARYRDTRQTAAIIERILSDIGQLAVWGKGDTR